MREALGVISEVLEIPADRLFFRVRRRQKGKDQYERLDSQRRFFQVQEKGLSFLVNFEDYLDTGLFLDHREVRRLIGELALGRRFLNLFGYTGTASVHAAAGGALGTTTVDLSRTYLDWAGRNLALNGFGTRDHELIQADCLRWPREQAGHRRWGLILLDPPSFSVSKRMTETLDVQRDHLALIQDAARLLEPGGILIFSNNLRRFRLEREALEGLGGLAIQNITAATLPKDFARNAQPFQAVDAMTDRQGGDTGVAGHLHVVFRIADHEGLGPVRPQLIHDLEQHLGVGLGEGLVRAPGGVEMTLKTPAADRAR